MIILQSRYLQQVIDERDACSRAALHGDGNRLVEGNNWRRIGHIETLVKSHNPAPVGSVETAGAGVLGGNGGFEDIAADFARREGALQMAAGLGNVLPVPAVAILILQQHDVTGWGQPGSPPGFMQQHQRQQAQGLGIRQKLHHEPAQAQRFGAQVWPVNGRELVGGAGLAAVALVIDQIDHLQDGLQARRKFTGFRNAVGNASLANLVFATHQTLRQRRRGDQKTPGDGGGTQSAHFAQRQGDLDIRRQRRVTAGKNQAQTIVINAAVVIIKRVFRGEILEIFQLHLPAVSPDLVDSLEAACGHQPGTGISWHTFEGPLLQGRIESFLQHVFGKIHITQQADQGGEHPSGFLLIDRFDLSGKQGGHERFQQRGSAILAQAGNRCRSQL